MDFTCRTTLPEKEGYYLGITNEKKFIVVLWENNKWWYDEYQDKKVLFRLKDEFIYYWTELDDINNFYLE